MIVVCDVLKFWSPRSWEMCNLFSSFSQGCAFVPEEESEDSVYHQGEHYLNPTLAVIGAPDRDNERELVKLTS